MTKVAASDCDVPPSSTSGVDRRAIVATDRPHQEGQNAEAIFWTHSAAQMPWLHRQPIASST